MPKVSSRIDIYVAIPMPFNEVLRKDEKNRATLYEMIDDLCSLSGKLDIDLFECGTVKLNIELLKGNRRRLKVLQEEFGRNILGECEIIKFSATVPFSNSFSKIKDMPPHAINRVLIRAFVLKRVSDILIIANLSRVGSIEVKDSLLLQDGKFQKHSKIPKMDAWPLQRAVDLAEKIKWPQLNVIDFDQVWHWVNNNKGFLNGFDNSPTGRALSAFSRVFEQGEDDEAMQLLWALIGIEALYVKGKVSVMEQVREKIQVLLGRQETHKKKISEMYEFRSRFMHGDLDFPGLCHIHDAMPEYEKYSDNQMETVTTAIAILAASLQEIIIRDWKGLEFSYSVVNLSSHGG
jgi:Apea-like HEPN